MRESDIWRKWCFDSLEGESVSERYYLNYISLFASLVANFIVTVSI